MSNLNKPFILSELERLIIERENLKFLSKIVKTNLLLKFQVFLTEEIEKRQKEINFFKDELGDIVK